MITTLATMDVQVKSGNDYELLQQKRDDGKVFVRVNAVVEAAICTVAFMEYGLVNRKVWMGKAMVKSFSFAHGVQDIVEWIDRNL